MAIRNGEVNAYKTHPIIVILLLIIFQPIAWFLMYKEKIYHRWFPYILWLNAVIAPFAYRLMIVSMSQVEVTYRRLNISSPNANLYTAFYVIIAESIVDIIAGVLLYRKINSQNSYDKFLKIVIWLLVLTFSSAVFIFGYSSLSNIVPLYNYTGSIGH